MDREAVIDLSSFDTDRRRKSLRHLLKETASLPREGDNINLHFHSFFSYNAHHFSPTRIAWEARGEGLYASAICDFDVLDGLEEYYEACLDLSMRSSVHLETRGFVSAYADREINSPGEPGVAYIMGAGFAGLPQGQEGEYLQFLKKRAGERNRSLIERINEKTPEVTLNYDEDVLPLTPASGATERHIVSAYVEKTVHVFPSASDRKVFWSELLGKSREEMEGLMRNPTALNQSTLNQTILDEAVRGRLVKRGGLGYVQPGPGSFPPVEEFISWVSLCRAIPMVAWLDGTTPGEQDPHKLLGDFKDMGAAALNIIPERNWNLEEAETRKAKQEKLREIVEAAEKLEFPINIGTEMNKPGLPFNDDLGVEALAPFRESFIRGARIVVGHSLLLRYADTSYVDDNGKIPGQSGKRNRFFESVGALPPLDRKTASGLQELGPDKALAKIRESVANRRWSL